MGAKGSKPANEIPATPSTPAHEVLGNSKGMAALREQQDAPPRSAREIALLRAMEQLDRVVRSRGSWDAARQGVACALEEAGLVATCDAVEYSTAL